MLRFDTGKKLEKAVGEEAAQIIIEALEKISDEQRKDAVTKGDLRETELRLQKEIREVELRLQKEIEIVRKEAQQIKYDLLKWQLGGWVALAAIMAKGFGWLGF